jgi:Tfp pilus assembly protein PilV
VSGSISLWLNPGASIMARPAKGLKAAWNYRGVRSRKESGCEGVTRSESHDHPRSNLPRHHSVTCRGNMEEGGRKGNKS